VPLSRGRRSLIGRVRVGGKLGGTVWSPFVVIFYAPARGGSGYTGFAED
jgi:hypothetical protein